MKRNKTLLLGACVLVLALGACSKDKKESSSTTTTTVTTTSTTAVKPAADSVGVPECDDYISKYEKCVATKVPEMARAPMQDAFARTRADWKAAAATPEGKQGLAIACKAAADAAKQAVAAYGCEM